MGQRLIAAVETLAAQLGLPESGDIDLPPVFDSAADQSHLQTVPPLYLAAELEAARLVPAVEVLAGLAVGGGLGGDLGPATNQVMEFWQRRHTRFTANERQAFFAQLFGADSGPALAVPGGTNVAFEARLIDLCEALYKVYPESPLIGLPQSQIAVQMAASAMAANLLPRAGGMAAFAARDLMNTIKESLSIFKSAPLQGVLGARSVWDAVRQVANTYLREPVDVASHVTRGKAGMLVLTWLADVLPQFEAPAMSLVAPNDPVIAAATAWLQASLTLHEHAVEPEQPRN